MNHGVLLHAGEKTARRPPPLPEPLLMRRPLVAALQFASPSLDPPPPGAPDACGRGGWRPFIDSRGAHLRGRPRRHVYKIIMRAVYCILSKNGTGIGCTMASVARSLLRQAHSRRRYLHVLRGLQEDTRRRQRLPELRRRRMSEVD